LKPDPILVAERASVSSAATRSRDLWACLGVFCAALLAYLPSLRGSLLWDDEAHVTKQTLRSLHGLWRIWFELGASQQYYPVLHSAFWVEHRLWGDNTLGYHLVNVLLHATSACLFAQVLKKLFEGRVAAGVPAASWRWFAAFLFALHPVCVESVAWISEQKNTLSTVFYLLSVLAYLRWTRSGTRQRFVLYCLATLLFVLALLSKSVTATLPAALLVALWWKNGNLSWKRDAVPLIPWFAVGIASGLFTAWLERNYGGAEGTMFAITFVGRCLLAGRVIWFYLGKLVWPANLMFIYPHWRMDPSQAWQYLYPLAALALLGLLWRQRRRFPGVLAAFLFFVGTLFPALGFFNVYPFMYSYVADHFQYLASLGIIALAAAGWGWAAGRWPAPGRIAAAAVLLLFGILTWRQCGNYRNSITLFQQTLERNPTCWMADNNIGMILFERGQVDEGVAHFERAERSDPANPLNYFHLGTVYYKLRRYPQAIAQLREAIRLDPDQAGGHYTLANVLADTDHPAEALEQYHTALRLKPAQSEFRANLGNLLIKLGRIDEALEQYEEEVRLSPKSAPAHSNLGITLVRLNRWREALSEFREELLLDPKSATPHFDYGTALMSSDDLLGAADQFTEALKINPDYTDARVNLGVVLTRTGRRSEALEQFGLAVRHDPSSPSAHTNYGVGLAGAGRLDEAIAEFREAIRLRPSDPEEHADLAKALEQTGKSDEARAELETAERLGGGR